MNYIFPFGAAFGFVMGCTLVFAEETGGEETADKAEAETAVAASAIEVGVNRFVLATGVEAREPTGVKETFTTADAHVYGFADVHATGSTTVTFTWTHGGKTYFERQMPVSQSKRFRTYTSVKAHAGDWTLALKDEQGTLLKEVSFHVEKEAAPIVAPQEGETATAAGEVAAS